MKTMDYLKRGIKNNHYSKLYILGFEYKGKVCGCFVNEENALKFAKLDTTSKAHNNEKCLRFKPNNQEKLAIMELATEVVVFDYSPYFMVKAGKKKYGSQYNNGHAFEQAIYKHCGLEWSFNYIRHNEGCDIEIDEIPYEIKYELGTFCKKSEFKK